MRIFQLFLLGLALALPNLQKFNEDEFMKFQESKMAQFVISFASMSNKLERPLVDLDYAIQDMYQDLKEALAEVEQDYFQRAAINKRIVDELDVNLGNAQIEIGQSMNLVENVLKPELKAQLNKKVEQLKDFVTQNRNALAREEQIQKDKTTLYNDKINDHQIALKSVDKALEIIQKYINGELDLNHKDKTSREVQEMTGCLNKKYDNYPIISALIESIPTYENLKQLKKIRYKLTRIRQSVQDQYNEDIFHDRTSTSVFEKRKQQLQNEHSMFQSQIVDNTHSFTAIQLKIAQEEEFQDIRRSDVQMYANQKNDENSAYAREIAIYQDLKNQYFREFQLGEKAILLVKSPQFSDLVKQKIDLKLRKTYFQ
ncbi:hypothetical protein pb186bvf_018634 [Paramecium bursaria]